MRAKANIRPRGNKFRVDITKDGQRHRVSCETAEEANSVLAKLELASKGLRVDQWTIHRGFSECYTHVWSKGQNTEHNMRHGKEAVLFFGETTKLDSITTERIDGWIARLNQIGNKPTTIKNKLAALSKIMTFAQQRRKMGVKPYIERPAVEHEGRMRYLTDPEEVQVITLMERRGKDCQAEAVIVLVDTGLRPSELWRMEARDVKMEEGYIYVLKTKGKKNRVVPMTQRVKDILARRMEGTPTGPLFPHDNWWLEDAWDRAKAEMGLTNDKEFVPYALRHTCASRLVQRGIDIYRVKKILGHTNIATTERYAKLNPQTLIEAMKVLEAC